MRYAEFLERLISRGMELTAWPEGYSWKYYKALRLTTEDIDYGCDFDSMGCCKYRSRSSSDKNIVMCCCSGCFNSTGHMRIFPKDGDTLKRLAALFVKPRLDWRNRETRAQGFWHRGKGCILPREYRSSLCLGYSCNSKEMDEKSRFLLNLIRKGRGKSAEKTERRFDRFVNKKKFPIRMYSVASDLSKIPQIKEAVWAFVEAEMRREQLFESKNQRLRHGHGGNIALEPGIIGAVENHEFSRLRYVVDLFSGDVAWDMDRMKFITKKVINAWRRDYNALQKTSK